MDAHQILGLVEQQIGNYRELLAVSVEQDEKAAESDLSGDALLAYALRKSSLMNRIDEVERDLAPVREGWTDRRIGFSADEGRRIESSFADLKATLGRVIEVEEKNQAALAGRMGMVQESIARTGRANLIKKAYGRNGPGENRFMDRSS